MCPQRQRKIRKQQKNSAKPKTSHKAPLRKLKAVDKSGRPLFYDIPKRRRIQVFAFDPMLSSDPILGRGQTTRITIDIPNEPLLPGPQGSLIEVVDYDGASDCFYPPVDLNEAALLMQDGIEPSESDPRFHQQMVYAVAMKVVENFESALGRRISFRNRRRLRLFPHAFQGANSFYDRSLVAVLFGYFKADDKNPGPNLPGQTVFSCLSQDIIAHEVTHALVDRLRPHFIEPTNRDVRGFHEGFSDIVSIFQHFSFPSILREIIQETRTDLRSSTPLIQLARQFGYATGKGQALRDAVFDSKPSDKGPDPSLYVRTLDVHQRGAILVAAIFEAFFNTYQSRIKDLVRIATGGSGQLPPGHLHPDLVNRIADEAARASQAILRMCIRAFDYLPPIDVTFGDYLRALVTADYELNPNDINGQRQSTIESFRLRGIYPERVSSLAQSSILWERAPDWLPPFPTKSLGELIIRNFTKEYKVVYHGHLGFVQIGSANRGDQAHGEAFDLSRGLALEMQRYAAKYAGDLGLDPNFRISLRGFHPVFRVTPDGELLVEMVAQFTQQDETPKHEIQGFPLRGGVTLISSHEGKVRYVISKPLATLRPSRNLSETSQRAASARYSTQRQYLEELSAADPYFSWTSKRGLTTSPDELNFARLHREIP